MLSPRSVIGCDLGVLASEAGWKLLGDGKFSVHSMSHTFALPQKRLPCTTSPKPYQAPSARLAGLCCFQIPTVLKSSWRSATPHRATGKIRGFTTNPFLRMHLVSMDKFRQWHREWFSRLLCRAWQAIVCVCCKELFPLFTKQRARVTTGNVSGTCLNRRRRTHQSPTVQPSSERCGYPTSSLPDPYSMHMWHGCQWCRESWLAGERSDHTESQTLDASAGHDRRHGFGRSQRISRNFRSWWHRLIGCSFQPTTPCSVLLISGHTREAEVLTSHFIHTIKPLTLRVDVPPYHSLDHRSAWLSGVLGGAGATMCRM